VKFFLIIIIISFCVYVCLPSSNTHRRMPRGERHIPLTVQSTRSTVTVQIFNKTIPAVHSILFNIFICQTLGFLESTETSFKAFHSLSSRSLGPSLPVQVRLKPISLYRTLYPLNHLFSVCFLGNSRKISHYFFLCLLVYDLFCFRF
jgi:hypothetical protein